ncbi:MAG: PilN domain-containing protein [Saccharofermentanales bacterium]
MIKSDINLIPRKKKIPLSVTLGILFGIIGFVLLVIVGIALPAASLKNQQTKLDTLKQELATYANVESDYTLKLAELTSLQQQQTNYNAFAATDKQTLELMQQIIAVTPTTITIQEQSYMQDNIVLLGTAKNNIEIARFEVALRKMGLFSDILLGTISGPDTARTFDFVLTHKVAEVQAEGGAGK